MKKLEEYINESKEKFNEQNMLAIMCAVQTIVNNGNYSLCLKENNVKPTISEKTAFDMAQILLNQKIWEIK